MCYSSSSLPPPPHTPPTPTSPSYCPMLSSLWQLSVLLMYIYIYIFYFVMKTADHVSPFWCAVISGLCLHILLRQCFLNHRVHIRLLLQCLILWQHLRIIFWVLHWSTVFFFLVVCFEVFFHFSIFVTGSCRVTFQPVWFDFSLPFSSCMK